MDCSPPGPSVRGMDSSGKNTGVGCHALLQGIFLTQGLNPRPYPSCIGRRVLHHRIIWEAPAASTLSAWSLSVAPHVLPSPSTEHTPGRHSCLRITKGQASVCVLAPGSFSAAFYTTDPSPGPLHRLCSLLTGHSSSASFPSPKPQIRDSH